VRSAIAAVVVFAWVAVVSPSLVAQWPSHPTRNVPRGADGKPTLTAPPPRTADGVPDLTGIWNYAGVLGFRGGPPPSPPGTPVQATFWNIEAGFKEGLPFTPWGAEVRRQRMAGNSKDNPDAACLPLGHMQLHTHSQPRKMIQTKDLIVIIYEANANVRQIFLDGRAAPTNDPQPWWYGYSRGHWEGDTLVVETTNFRGDEKAGWLDVNGSPYTDALKMTERFRRPNFGSLEIDITIDDPKAYTKPFTVRVNQRIMVDSEMIEFICNENEKSTEHLK
jgi:hypothetical protein